MDNITLGIIIVMIILIGFVLFKKNSNSSSELFNSTFHQSVLENDMDTIKDNQGRTLNDYILANHVLYGSRITSPFGV